MSNPLEAFGYEQQGRAIQRASGLNAEIEMSRGTSKAELVREKGSRAAGKIRANIGKSGVTMSGSAKLAVAEALENASLDALQIEENAMRSASSIRREGEAGMRAANIRAEGARSRANQELLGTAVTAGSLLYGGK